MLKTITIGLLSGFLFAIPAGPVAVLIIQNAAKDRLNECYYTLTGLICAEILYIVFLLSGLYPLLTERKSLMDLLTVIGGLLILWLGGKGLWEHKRVPLGPQKEGNTPESITEGAYKTEMNKFLTAFASSFSITFFNPAILFFLLGIIASYHGLTGQNTSSQSQMIALMTFTEIGCILWFTFLIVGIHKLRDRLLNFFNNHLITYSNIFLIIFGLSLLYKQL